MKQIINYIVGIFILLCLTTISCKTDLDEIKALANKEELPDVTVIDLRAEYSISEYTQIRLITPLAYRFTRKDKQYSLFPKGINLMFFDKFKNLNSSLKADYAVYYDEKRFAKAKGNVILTNINGSILRTEELFLDEKNEKIYSVKSVNITDKDGFEITGKGGFESNIDFTVYRFTDVKGKIIKETDEDFLTGEEEEDTPYVMKPPPVEENVKAVKKISPEDRKKDLNRRTLLKDKKPVKNK